MEWLDIKSSQSDTNWFLTPHCDYSLALLYPTGCFKKPVRIGLSLTFLQWFLQIIFTIHMPLSPKPAIGDISSHRLIFDLPLTLFTCAALSNRVIQKTLWELVGFDFLTLIFTHLFYNSCAVNPETCDWGYLVPQTNCWHAAHTAPLLMTSESGSAAKRITECIKEWVIFFTHHFFHSIDMVFKPSQWCSAAQLFYADP